MSSLTEKQWNEIYDDIYNVILRSGIENGKTEDDCKEVMNEIKEILIPEEV